MAHQLTVYTTITCGPCRRLKRQLSELGIPFKEIDVDEHPEFNARIKAASGGYRTVPTVEAAGRLLVNPSIREVVEALTRVA
ncbi:MAG: NrdH-redoxin [Actinomycetota bacterium]|nr:NrdH-redoxin [Actinomycetota bacterium]